MTRLTPRERADEALDTIIDLSGNAPTRDPRLDRAYRDLAAALNAIYGPLPNEGLTLAHLSDATDI